MKKKSIFIKCSLSLLLALALLLYMTGTVFAFGDAADQYNGDFVSDEVLAPADSLEQALQIAAVYGLELKSYAYDIAVLATSEPEKTVAQSQTTTQSLAAGIRVPELSLNMIYNIYELDDMYQTDYINFIDYTDREWKLYPSLWYNGNQKQTDNEWKLYSTLAYGEEWHHEFMDCRRAWDITKGEGVVIAIIDTGIDIYHPKFSGKIMTNSYNAYTDNIGLEYVKDDHASSHGTHVSGIAAASMEVGDPSVCGVAPEAKILAVKVNIPETGSITEASWIRGLNYSVENGADIVNMSFGSSSPTTLGRNAIINATTKGVTLVCAAGNERNTHPNYPARYNETIAVSAVRQGGLFELAYSNYGPEIDVAAPGSEILSTVSGGLSAFLSGTSMAAPNVAGICALVKSLHPEYTPQQIRDILNSTARQTGDLGDKDSFCGNGYANAYAAVLGIDALYSVTYDFNDGERPPVTIKAAPGNNIIAPGIPIRNGYAFGGWFTSPDGGGKFDFSTTVDKNMILYAGWFDIVPGTYAYEFPDTQFRKIIIDLLNESFGGARTEADTIADTEIKMLSQINELYINYPYNNPQSILIKDLKGIEYLTGLLEFICYNTLVEELDMSNNTELITLDFSSNVFMGNPFFGGVINLSYLRYNQLAKIDVSKNTKLEQLRLYFNDNLTELELPKSSMLERLELSGCSLANLDATNYPALMRIDCDQNKLTKLNVSDCPNLERLVCTTNLLTEIDTKSCPKLRILSCENNLLKELDVSNNDNLKEFHCINNLLTEIDLSQNSVLTSVFCGKNRLTELDLSNNTQITWIRCENNQLTELDISSNTELRQLECCDNQLTELVVSTNPHLTNINCSGNLLTELDIAQNNQALINLNCARNLLTSLDITNNNLKTLYCEYNFMKTPDNVIGWQYYPDLVLGDTFIFYPQYGEEITAAFADPNFLAAVRSMINKPNGAIFTEDVLGITTLSVPSLNISSLAGIEYFVNLTRLYCQNNQLTELNISNNPALVFLNCSYNNMEIPGDVIGWEQTTMQLGSSFIFYPQNGHTNAEKPIITIQPQSITINQGETATLTVEAFVSKGELSYQWYFSGAMTPAFRAIPGAVNASYETSDAGSYYCVVTNTDEMASGIKTASVNSNYIMVRVNTLTNAQIPNITLQPTDIIADINETATLTVTANVTKGTLSYQWYSNTSKTTSDGVLIIRATNFSYTAPTNIAGTNYYYCVITNTDNEATGNKTATATSNAVAVTVTPMHGNLSFDGKILYQTSSHSATIKLYYSNGTLINTATTNPDGTYALSAPILATPEATGYTLVVTKPGYLSYTIKNLTLIESEAIETIDIRQMAGDIDGNGVVNATDLTYLLSEFNRNPVNSNYPYTDIDGNGVVNATDLTYLLAGFNKHDVEIIND